MYATTRSTTTPYNKNKFASTRNTTTTTTSSNNNNNNNDRTGSNSGIGDGSSQQASRNVHTSSELNAYVEQLTDDINKRPPGSEAQDNFFKSTLVTAIYIYLIIYMDMSANLTRFICRNRFQ